jgi:hypothetical protein
MWCQSRARAGCAHHWSIAEDSTMAKNEETSPRAAKIAAHVLSTGAATKKEALTIAGALLNQAPDRRSPAPKPKPAPKPTPKRGGKR